MQYLDFHEKNHNKHGWPQVTVIFDGIKWGDPLDDNNPKEDFYRYHDAIHVGLDVLTGWSPVNRHLEGKETDKRERKLEECLSLFAFTEAKQRNFFRDKKPSSMLIRIIRQLTEETPLKNQTTKQWSENLVTIFNVMGQLADNRGGRIEVDYKDRIFRLVA